MLTYNVLVAILDAALLAGLRLRPGWTLGTAALVLQQGVGGVLALVCAVDGEIRLFGALGLYAWCVFLHAPVLLLGGAWLARARKGLAATCVAGAVLLLVVYVDAFRIEPTWLEVSRHEIASAKVTAPVRIVVLADIQTDAVGDFEREVVRRAVAEEPDLVLLPGDYVHLRHGQVEEMERQHRALRDVFREEGLAAPLGVHAVGGNTDGPGWERVFAGLDVAVHVTTATKKVGELQVTALSTGDSRARPQIPARDRFHVVFGHHPDFALGAVSADLLVAGHCHGGQVRLPLLGPPLTLSAIPRRWTEGLHEIRPGTWLSVSRGIGMERVGAPELRFNCRPELVVIDVVPAGG